MAVKIFIEDFKNRSQSPDTYNSLKYQLDRILGVIQDDSYFSDIYHIAVNYVDSILTAMSKKILSHLESGMIEYFHHGGFNSFQWNPVIKFDTIYNLVKLTGVIADVMISDKYTDTIFEQKTWTQISSLTKTVIEEMDRIVAICSCNESKSLEIPMLNITDTFENALKIKHKLDDLSYFYDKK